MTAYNGALSLLGTPAYVQAAAGIMAVEAYHAGAIRSLLIQNGDVEVPEYGVSDPIKADCPNFLRVSAELPTLFAPRVPGMRLPSCKLVPPILQGTCPASTQNPQYPAAAPTSPPSPTHTQLLNLELQ